MYTVKYSHVYELKNVSYINLGFDKNFTYKKLGSFYYSYDAIILSKNREFVEYL